MTRGRATHIELTLVERPGATRVLRDAIDRVADPLGASPADRFDLKLAATEALTNALRDSSESHVTLDGGPEALDVEVASGRAFGTQSPHGDEGGRGIPLMLALVDSVEFAHTSHGTRVRMQKRIAA
jgi:serine/threonine-protein kinase RsbW